MIERIIEWSIRNRFLVFVIALTVLSGIPDREDGPDIYSLFFGATIGMWLPIIRTGHLRF